MNLVLHVSFYPPSLLKQLSMLLLPSSHDARPWHQVLTSLPPLPQHRELSLPRPAFQTHILFPEVNAFSFQIPPLHFVLTHKPLTLFPPFLPLVQHIMHAFLSFPSPQFPLGDQEITQYLITVEVINTAALRPLFYLHYSPTFITGVLPPRIKIQTIISQYTGLSLSSHLISFISSHSWPCAFAFSLCSSVKYLLFFKALLKIQLSNLF